MSESPQRTPFHHGDLRRALLDAGSRMLEAHGVAELSLRKLASAAGVSHAAPYHHFPNRAALLAALAEQGFDMLAQQSREATAQAGSDPFERLAALGEAYIRYALEHPHTFRMMFRPEMAEPETNRGVDAAGQRAFGHLVAAVDACLVGHDVAPPEREAYTLSAWSTVHGAAALRLDGPVGRKPNLPDPANYAASVARTWAELFRKALSRH